jgi:hypothetical protein
MKKLAVSLIVCSFPSFAHAWLERGAAILMLGHDELAQADFAKYLFRQIPGA